MRERNFLYSAENIIIFIQNILSIGQSLNSSIESFCVKKDRTDLSILGIESMKESGLLRWVRIFLLVQKLAK